MASRCRAEPIGNSDESPWQQGYALAEELQNDLDGRVDGERVDMEAILDHLGVEVTDANLSDGAIRGVAIAGPRHRSGIVWNRNNHFNADAQGLRFTLAHELCHLLFDRSAGQRLAIASGPWAPPSLEQRANAFAAMLLMPTEDSAHLGGGHDRAGFDTAQGVSSVAEAAGNWFSPQPCGICGTWGSSMTARCSALKPNVNDCDSVGNGPPARFHKPFLPYRVSRRTRRNACISLGRRSATWRRSRSGAACSGSSKTWSGGRTPHFSPMIWFAI